MHALRAWPSSEEDADVAVLEVEPPEGDGGAKPICEMVICRSWSSKPCMPEPGMCLRTSPGLKTQELANCVRVVASCS